MIPLLIVYPPEPARIPEHLMGGLHRYVEHRVETGSFLRAVLENDLKESVARASAESMIYLFDIVSWLYNEAPQDCWGSKEKVRAWLARRETTDGT